MRTTLIILLLALIVVIVLYAVGPRVKVDTNITFDENAIGSDPDAYLAQSESRFDDIRQGLEKEIIWAFPNSKARTPLSIVYVHGFSASKGETRPLPDIVAREFSANLFYTRLAGHGRDSAAMAEATVNAWVNDLAEAVAIGRAIGERVIIIAVSTGGGLSAWGATQPGLMDGVAGLVLVSPNFGPRETGTWMLLLPWGETLARLYVGEERGFEPANDMVRRFWTYHYPVKALLPLAAITTLAQAAPYEQVDIPALFVFSENDQVVRPEETRKVASRWGADWKIITVGNTEDPMNHVIAGDALSPSMTGKLASDIVEWIREKVPQD